MPELTDAILPLAGLTLSSLVAWLVRSIFRSRQARDAAAMVACVAEAGVRAGWERYTRAAKAAREDGKLTDEEKAEARRVAFHAALAEAGERGRKVIEAGLGGGWEKALEAALEDRYKAFRASGEAR